VAVGRDRRLYEGGPHENRISHPQNDVSTNWEQRGAVLLRRSTSSERAHSSMSIRGQNGIKDRTPCDGRCCLVDILE
jgi:hypothetical protein